MLAAAAAAPLLFALTLAAACACACAASTSALLFPSGEAVLSQTAPLIVGHRGYSARYPENTMLSFQKAFEAGAAGLEMDLRLTSDDVIVLMHDSTLDRTTNCSGHVLNYTFLQLREQCVANFPAKFGDQFSVDPGASAAVFIAQLRIPTFEEALQFAMQNGLFVVMDLKVEQLGQFIQTVMDRVPAGPFGQSSVIASCWTPTQVLDIKQYLAPNVTVKQYLGYLDPPLPAGFFATQQTLGVQGFSLEWTNVSAAFVAQATARLMPVYGWSLNNSPQSFYELYAAAKWGLAGLIVDDLATAIAVKAALGAGVDLAYSGLFGSTPGSDCTDSSRYVITIAVLAVNLFLVVALLVAVRFAPVAAPWCREHCTMLCRAFRLCVPKEFTLLRDSHDEHSSKRPSWQELRAQSQFVSSAELPEDTDETGTGHRPDRGGNRQPEPYSAAYSSISAGRSPHEHDSEPPFAQLVDRRFARSPPASTAPDALHSTEDG